MNIRIAAPALVLALASPVAVQAQDAAPKPVETGKRVVAKVPGLSEAGNAVVTRSMEQPDPQMLEFSKQRAALGAEFQTAIAQKTIDLGQIEALMKREEQLQDEVRARTRVRILGLLNDLPEADRGPFLRALRVPGSALAAKPAAPAKKLPNGR
jgi:hypothetical protein